MGDMAELYDYDYYDDEFDEFNTYCKYCKSGPFTWSQLSTGQWRLFDFDCKMHECNKHPSVKRKR